MKGELMRKEKMCNKNKGFYCTSTIAMGIAMGGGNQLNT